MSRPRLLAAVALALCNGCSASPSNDDTEPAATAGPSGAECAEGSALNYERFARDFFDDYCVRCHDSQLEGSARHGAPRSLNYDTLDGILEVDAERIDAMAAAGPKQYNTFMPPSEPRPSRGEREQLAEWLACGRP